MKNSMRRKSGASFAHITALSKKGKEESVIFVKT